MKKLNIFSTDSNQLSFLELGVADNYYRKFVCKPLDELDNRLIFKKIFHILFQLAAYGLLIYGIYLLFGNLFGSEGYFKSISYFKSGEKAFGIILSIISFVVSALALFYVFSIVNNRSRKLYQKKFTNLLEYIFGHLLPVAFVMMGEIIVVLTFLIFFNQFLSAISVSPVYNPLVAIFGFTTDIFINTIYDLTKDSEIKFLIPTFEQINNPVYLYSDSFKDGFSIALNFLVMSVYTLIFTYVLIEIYKYVYKLVVTFIEFLPKFGIPFAIRHKFDNAKPSNMFAEANNVTIDPNDI